MARKTRYSALQGAIKMALHENTPEHERSAAQAAVAQMDPRMEFVDRVDPTNLPMPEWHSSVEWERRLRAEQEARETAEAENKQLRRRQSPKFEEELHAEKLEVKRLNRIVHRLARNFKLTCECGPCAQERIIAEAATSEVPNIINESVISHRVKRHYTARGYAGERRIYLTSAVGFFKASVPFAVNYHNPNTRRLENYVFGEVALNELRGNLPLSEIEKFYNVLISLRSEDEVRDYTKQHIEKLSREFQFKVIFSTAFERATHRCKLVCYAQSSEIKPYLVETVTVDRSRDQWSDEERYTLHQNFMLLGGSYEGGKPQIKDYIGARRKLASLMQSLFGDTHPWFGPTGDCGAIITALGKLAKHPDLRSPTVIIKK